MLDYIIWYYSGQKNDNFSRSKGPNQTDPKKAWVLVLDPERVFGLGPKQKSTNVQNFWHSKVFGSKNFWLFLKLLNPFWSTCLKLFFGETHLNMPKLLLEKKIVQRFGFYKMWNRCNIETSNVHKFWILIMQ